MLKLFALVGLLFLPPNFAHAAECPVINGKFQRIAERDGKLIRQTRYQYTRVESGEFSYSIDKEVHFQAADGSPRYVKRPDDEGTITITCGNNSVTLTSRAKGANPYVTKITPLSNDEMRIEESDALRSGIYKRAD